MGTMKNLLNSFMPHFESRRTSAVLGSLNAELVLDVDGDNNALLHIFAVAALTATYAIDGSPDGTSFYPVLTYAYTPGCINGTIPSASQPLISEASTTAIQRTLIIPCGGLRKVRVRLSAWTSGSAIFTINSDACDGLNPYIRDQKAATLVISATAAVGVAVTATLPAVVGLRHYIDRISVTRSATAALTASATPVLVTTTNLPGPPALTFGSDVAGIGVDKELVLDIGSSGLAATAVNTATTVVCPAYVGVIWRVNVFYRLGL